VLAANALAITGQGTVLGSGLGSGGNQPRRDRADARGSGRFGCRGYGPRAFGPFANNRRRGREFVSHRCPHRPVAGGGQRLGCRVDSTIHGAKSATRKLRGRRLIFPEELAPVQPDAPVPPLSTKAEIPWREIVAVERAETERLRLAVERAEQTIANAIEAQALEDLRNQYADALELLREAQDAEMAWIMRLRDEDDFLLLAA
jgi:hypothetical protein